MPVPQYYEMYFLESLKDGQEHTIKEVKKFVAINMGITEADLIELLPSGKQYKYDNRIGWTRTYLKKAGLIVSPARGVFILTAEGKNVIEQNLAIINDEYLMKYDSFKEFINHQINPEKLYH